MQHLRPDEIQALAVAFDGIVSVLESNNLSPPLAEAILLKILVMVVQGHRPDKDIFLTQASAVWDLENFIKPHSADIH
jgi:hypothetical protein